MTSTAIAITTAWTKVVDAADTPWSLFNSSNIPIYICYSTGAPADNSAQIIITPTRGWLSTYGLGEIYARARENATIIVTK